MTGIASPSAWQGRRTLVTGGLGFIGSNLALRLAGLGARVTVADGLLPHHGGNRANLAGAAGIELRHVDLNDEGVLPELVEGQEFVFNLAGQVSHLDSMAHPLADLDSNVRCHVKLLEACRHLAPKARIVFASTRQIYGRPAYLPVDEKHPLAPVDVNGVHKMAGEAHHTMYHRVYDLDTVSLRLTNVYGPRMRIADARLTFLGLWLRRVVQDDVIEVWGGEQLRDLTYVDDAVDAFLAAASPAVPGGSVLNVGGAQTLSLGRLAALLVDIAGSGRCEVKPFPPERKRIDIGDYTADDRAFRDLTGWQAQVDVPTGLRRSVAYYRQHLGAYLDV